MILIMFSLFQKISFPHFCLIFIITPINCVSIWDPFCKVDILYTPYVRVYQKGRPGSLLRDRGPGFIDVSSMEDIYVCTNGLVMMYYIKTTGLGHVFEHGQLQWTPHHCQLYNQKGNQPLKGDHPRKILLSILLIGHPQDYRRPALQMFVAPLFDVPYGDYINMTSLILIGTEGECIIEKGPERARLRIRNQEPKRLEEWPPEEAYNKPPIYCQLDAQKKLGQIGVINLGKPGKAGLKGDETLFEFKERKKGFKGTPFENNRNKSSYFAKKMPRFKPTSLKEKHFSEANLAMIAEVADDVYAALIDDKTTRFIGCLRYPDFSLEQMKIISFRKNVTEQLDLSKESGLLIKETEPEFWAAKVKVPWPQDEEDSSKQNEEERFKIYVTVDVSAGEIESYEDAHKKVEEAETDLKTKREANAENPEIKKAENILKREQILFSLWPFKKSYEELYKYVKDLEEQVKKAWEKVYTDTFEDLTAFSDWTDPEAKKPSVVAYWREKLLLNISQTKYDRRYEPYNRQLVVEYERYVNETGILGSILRKKSVAIGPMISNAETLYSSYKVYKNLLKKAVVDLEKAVKSVEKGRKPVEYFGGDVFDKQFADIMIEIADAENGFVSHHDDILNANACYDLPAINVSCNGIKPSSPRAGQLLKDVKGKGRDWGPEDSWRGEVLELISKIFTNACPYIGMEFASSIAKVIKGYLLAEPLGTGLTKPIEGSRLEANDHIYQNLVYNQTYNETDMENMTEVGEGKLPPMRPFWEAILKNLRNCSEDPNLLMEFWHVEEEDLPAYVTFKKYFPNNQTVAYFEVDELMMVEQADWEYSFNWAVDINWRIFGTVLGMCGLRGEIEISHFPAKFYALYSEDFLHPLRQIWMSNRDNPVFSSIFGSYYYNQGKGERWTKICMESSFMFSGAHPDFRPPRNLYVNDFTEMNYFVKGPLSGTSGLLGAVDS